MKTGLEPTIKALEVEINKLNEKAHRLEALKGRFELTHKAVMNKNKKS